MLKKYWEQRVYILVSVSQRSRTNKGTSHCTNESRMSEHTTCTRKKALNPTAHPKSIQDSPETLWKDSCCLLDTLLMSSFERNWNL